MLQDNHGSNTSEIQASSFHTDNFAAMPPYILERPSSWSISRIRPSCPRSRVRLNLLLDLFPQVYSCLLWPTQYLAVCSSSSHFTLDPFLACWRPKTCTQVNSTLVLHHTHGHAYLNHIDNIHSPSLHFLHPFWAGRLPSTLPGRHNPIARKFLSNFRYNMELTPLQLYFNSKIKSSVWHQPQKSEAAAPASTSEVQVCWHCSNPWGLGRLALFQPLRPIGRLPLFQPLRSRGAGSVKTSQIQLYWHCSKLWDPGLLALFQSWDPGGCWACSDLWDLGLMTIFRPLRTRVIETVKTLEIQGDNPCSITRAGHALSLSLHTFALALSHSFWGLSLS
jgi:hypothetical protein